MALPYFRLFVTTCSLCGLAWRIGGKKQILSMGLQPAKTVTNCGSCVFGFMRIRRTSPAGAIVIAVLGLGWAGQRVQASGYALREQSASALGNAFAGATAGAEDVSYMFFNPAGLTRHSGSQIIGIGNLIIPHLTIHDARASTGGGVPIGGNEGGRDAGEGAFVPVFYGLLDLQGSFGLQQNMKLGLGVNEPFGVRDRLSQRLERPILRPPLEDHGGQRQPRHGMGGGG